MCEDEWPGRDAAEDDNEDIEDDSPKSAMYEVRVDDIVGLISAMRVPLVWSRCLGKST
jgi:hypothetical protein